MSDANGTPLYDPELRRDTPLTRKLVERIRRDGPIAVGDYMTTCLGDPEHGYYRTRAGIGRLGDFVTAPEISQTFGELIGLWCAVVWRAMGAPARIELVELGGGRGTMMLDLLRASRAVPGFLTATRVSIVEIGEALRNEQCERLAGHHVEITWRADLAEVPAGPSLIVGNEFLDALPIDQTIEVGQSAMERTVALGMDGRLAFGRRPSGTAMQAAVDPLEVEGSSGETIVERRRDGPILRGAAERARDHPTAALLVDYGSMVAARCDTLQAVRGQRYEHPLTSPGEADLSAHVDFDALARAARALGLAVDGPVTQGEFLGALGIVERASRLMAANPSRALEIESGVARLTAPHGMGGRFKAVALRSPTVPPTPGFPAPTETRRA